MTIKIPREKKEKEDGVIRDTVLEITMKTLEDNTYKITMKSPGATDGDVLAATVYLMWLCAGGEDVNSDAMLADLCERAKSVRGRVASVVKGNGRA